MIFVGVCKSVKHRLAGNERESSSGKGGDLRSKNDLAREKNRERLSGVLSRKTCITTGRPDKAQAPDWEILRHVMMG